METRNFAKLYVCIPPTIRLEETLQHHGILRQMGAAKNADQESIQNS